MRGFRFLLVVLWLAGCSRSVPPGARLELLYPPPGTLTGPKVSLLVEARAWGPAVVTVGGDGVERFRGLRPSLPFSIRVDGRLVGRRKGRGVMRVDLGRLVPGTHHVRVTALGGLLSSETRFEVREPPPVAFVTEPPHAGVPGEVFAFLEGRWDGPAAGVVRTGDRFLAWRREGEVLRFHRVEKEKDTWRLRPVPGLEAVDATAALRVTACDRGFALALLDRTQGGVELWRAEAQGAARRLLRLTAGELAPALAAWPEVARAAPADFFGGLRCHGDRLVLDSLPVRGDDPPLILNLVAGPSGRWRIRALAGGWWAPLGGGHWLVLRPSRGRLELDTGERVALPLPPGDLFPAGRPGEIPDPGTFFEAVRFRSGLPPRLEDGRGGFWRIRVPGSRSGNVVARQ